MKLVELKIKGISYSETQSGTYALILNEAEGDRISLEKEIKPTRPLTHDLFKNFASRFEIHVKQVIIHKLLDGVFYASLICERDKIEEIIDSRTSDAVALALRFNAPIFTYDTILKRAGFSAAISTSNERKLSEDNWIQEFVTEQSKQPTALPEKLEKISLSKLKTLLKKFVTAEDYEKAALIRDEISKRKQ
jgi:bifunctional DNase/RNase